MDGTDFCIKEPTPRDNSWYTFKFKCAGVRYEIGVCIQTGNIVWIHGPFKPSVHDLTIFRLALKNELDDGERVEADRGYIGDESTSIPSDDGGNARWHRQKSLVRARHKFFLPAARVTLINKLK